MAVFIVLCWIPLISSFSATECIKSIRNRNKIPSTTQTNRFKIHTKHHSQYHSLTYRTSTLPLTLLHLVESDQSEPVQIWKASLLIAGTTVGGGFLALPQTVVVPLGGFVPSAISLTGVWLFFLVQSLVLSECFVQCHKERQTQHTTTISSDKMKVIGIPSLVHHGIGQRGSFVATVLLILVTEATLVSQLSRAGSLLAGTGNLLQYRIGCILAGTIGAILSLGGSSRRHGKTQSQSQSQSQSQQSFELTPSRQLPNRLATDVNAILTIIFLASAILLFQTGSQTATWSHCFDTSFISSPFLLTGKVVTAIPTMLQLLAFGEILPHVCHMLKYQPQAIRTSILWGSSIPLLLLTGWAGLGVALLGPLTNSDPVQVLLSTGSIAMRQRLLILATSAIGTTILGSFMALESAYHDITQESSDSNTSHSLSDSWLQHPLVATLSIVIPPMAISITSPTVFLRAIDFAGSYPVLLLFGVIPPILALKMKKRNPEQTFIKGPTIRYVGLLLLSMFMVTMSAVPDMQAMTRWIVSQCHSIP